MPVFKLFWRLPGVVSAIVVSVRAVYGLALGHAGRHEGPELDDITGGELEGVEVGDENLFS